MAESIDQTPQTDVQAVVLSILIPGVIAAGFIYLACLPNWEPSGSWIGGMVCLVPLELVRAIMLSQLAKAYKESAGAKQATLSFLLSVAALVVFGVFYFLVNFGGQDTVRMLAEPALYQFIGLPIVVMAIDGLVGIFSFSGDAKYQATRLQAVVADSLDWLRLTLLRIPLVAGPVYCLLLWAKHAGVILAFWVPEPGSTGLFYAAGYFFGKAAVVAHVFTAHYAQTGKRLLDIGWIQRVLNPKWLAQDPYRSINRHTTDVGYRDGDEPVKSVLAFEDKLIQSIKDKSGSAPLQ